MQYGRTESDILIGQDATLFHAQGTHRRLDYASGRSAARCFVFLLFFFTLLAGAFPEPARALAPDQLGNFQPEQGIDPTQSTIDVRRFGAVGNGRTDDTAAITAAQDHAQKIFEAGGAPEIYFPAGNYVLSTAIPAFKGHISLRGDGTFRSFIKILPSLRGDVFQWSETLMRMSSHDSTMDIEKQGTGVTVSSLSIVGDTSSPNQQNAFVFYDRNDNVLFRDVSVYYLNGGCLIVGKSKRIKNAFLRESQFYNFHCRNVGNNKTPSIDINSQGEGDASNQIYFWNIKIVFPLGIGLRISNEVESSATRNLYFYGLMVHGFTPKVRIDADLVVIGDRNTKSRVRDLYFVGFNGNASYPDQYTVRVSAVEPAFAPFNIDFLGAIGSGYNGVNVEAGRSLRFRLMTIAVTDTAFRLGSAPLVSGRIELDINDPVEKLKIDVHSTSVNHLYLPPKKH